MKVINAVGARPASIPPKWDRHAAQRIADIVARVMSASQDDIEIPAPVAVR